MVYLLVIINCIMMKLTILALVLVASQCLPLPFETTEKKSLLYYPENNFYILNAALHRILNEEKPDSTLKYHSGSFNLDLMITYFKQLQSLYRINKDTVSFESGAITYKIAKAFTFDLDMSFVLTFLVMPMSGVCTFRLTAEDVTYRLQVKDTTIVPSFEGNWKLEIFNVTNSMALQFGARKVMGEAAPLLKTYLTQVINEALLADVQRFYEGYFGTTNYFIIFPHLLNTSIAITHKFDKLTSGAIKDEPIIQAHYEQHFDPIPVPANKANSIDEEGFLRSFKMQIESIAEILRWEIYLTNNVFLTQDVIPADSFFQADLSTLARVFPDLLLEYGNVPVKIAINGTPTTLIHGYNYELKTVYIKGMQFTALITLPTLGLQVLKTTFTVNAQFLPFFTADPHDTKRVYLNLQAVKGCVAVLQAENLLVNKDIMFIPEAVKEYFDDILNNFFLRYHRTQVLGTGLLLSFGFPVAHWNIKTTSETGDDLKIYLFPSEF